jgi:hypothetical protein
LLLLVAVGAVPSVVAVVVVDTELLLARLVAVLLLKVYSL